MRCLPALMLLGTLAFADVSLPGTRPATAADCDARGKQVQAIDLNGDGKPDVWKLYATKDHVLVCKRTDLNFDGKIDLQVHYARDGQPTLEEYDLDFDGRIDMWRSLEHGKRQCEAMDLDADGKPDLWKRYQGDTAVSERSPSGACAALQR